MPFSTLSPHTATRPGKVGSYLHEAGWGSIVTSPSQAGQPYNPNSVNPYPSPLNVGGDTRGTSVGEAIYASPPLAQRSYYLRRLELGG